MSVDAVAHDVRGAFVPTAEGTLFKVCRCRDPETGKPLRATCPKLRRQNGSWNPDHGRWTYQLELPPTADGNRRQLRPPPSSTAPPPRTNWTPYADCSTFPAATRTA